MDLLHWMNHTKVQVVDKKFYTCYDGVPAKNRDKKLLHVHELQCLTAPRQVNVDCDVQYVPSNFDVHLV